MALKLTRVDPLILPDHSYLDEGDTCYFLGEYTARAGYTFSGTNDLIQNLKKPMDRQNRPEWKYKTWAINRAGDILREAISDEWLESATIVPVPPSKAKDHADYDDRLLKVLQRMGNGLNLDVRELVIQKMSTAAAHESEQRPRPNELFDIYEIDDQQTEPRPDMLVIFDDLLTTGSHFKAMKSVLENEFPDIPIIGLFIARRAPHADNI